MQLTFLGKETQGGGSPTLFLTDRDTYVVQGWKVPNEDPATVVEIPAPLLKHLQPNTELGVSLEKTDRQWRDDDGNLWDTFTLVGFAVTDPEALGQLNIPTHESCVEVGRRRKGESNETAAGPVI